MTDHVLIPLAGIGTLQLTRAAYEAALIPIAKPEIPKSTQGPAPQQRLDPRSKQERDSPERPRGLRYIRLREVCTRVGVKQSTIYRLIALGRFPKQIKLSEHASAWIESEIEAFMLSRIEERDHHSLSLAAPESPYMRMGAVMKRTGLTSSRIYDLVRKKQFPKWAALPKIASAWLKEDVEAWLASNVGVHE